MNNLSNVNYKLALVVGYSLGISKIDFFVNEGFRTQEKQQEYYKKGVSKVDGIKIKSQHQLGRAIDIYYVGWRKDKDDNEKWRLLIDTFRTVGKQLGIKLIFGYDWGWDKPHIELARGE